MERIGTCEACGSTFPAGERGPIRRFCSRVCGRTTIPAARRSELARRAVMARWDAVPHRSGRTWHRLEGAITKVCVVCGRSWEQTDRKRRKLCAECRSTGTSVARARAAAAPAPVYRCEDCGEHFTRPVVRGQQPKRCPDCRRPTITCRRCGRRKRVKKPTARYCSSTCAKRHQAEQLRALRPSPPPISTALVHVGPVSQLPALHPARRPAPRRSEWWKLLVSGPCGWCGGQFTARCASVKSLPRFCSDSCYRMAGKYRRGRFLIPDRERLAIYDRDGWVCQLCGYDVDRDLPPSDAWAATLDHVEPQSAVLVPDHSPSNLRLAHRWCNSKRGAGAVSDADVRFQATLEVWRAMVEATVAYLSGPRTADRHEAFTQIINLTTDDLVAAI